MLCSSKGVIYITSSYVQKLRGNVIYKLDFLTTKQPNAASNMKTATFPTLATYESKSTGGVTGIPNT